MSRMQVLNSVEREAFDSAPIFSSLERKQYFDFPFGIRQRAANLRTPTNRLCFLLSSGYFKASKQFFPSLSFHQRDIEYVAQQAQIDLAKVDIGSYDKQTCARHQQYIRDFYGYRAFDREAEEFLQTAVVTMARSPMKPTVMFWSCVDLLSSKRIAIPKYFRISELVLAGLNERKKELVDVIKQALTTDVRQFLEQLFIQSHTLEGEASPSPTTAYKLTLLKRFSQSIQPSKVKERVADFKLFADYFAKVEPVLDQLELGPDGIRHYANSVLKSEIFQMTRRSDEDRYLHAIAFIAHQYFRLQDNLVDSLLSSLRNYQNNALRQYKEQCYARRQQQERSVRALLDCLDEQVLTTLDRIRHITDQTDLDDSEKVHRIRALIAGEKEDSSPPVAELSLLNELRDEVKAELERGDYWEVLESKSVRLQNRISPILKALTFQAEPSSQPLIAALEYFKERDGVVGKQAPRELFKPAEREAIYAGEAGFRVSLYKALLFIHIQNALKSGTFNLKHSYKYRSLDGYLIGRKQWTRNREALLIQAGLQEFSEPSVVLAKLDETLHQQYLDINDKIREGDNPFVTFASSGQFRLKTPAQEEKSAQPLQRFFPDRHVVPLTEVLATVNRHSRFLDEFQHWQLRYHHGKPPTQTFYAGIMGLGCGIGTRKMAWISPQIQEPELEHTVNWFFSAENIRAANDRVVRLMDRMELPNLYRHSPDRLRTSSDGQKFELRGDSLHAARSFKYFGQGQGVSIYSFIDERNILWHSQVLSASERESAYAIDGLMHNEVIRSDIHSTDTHGYSEVVFGTTHLLGISFAPRIKNLKKQRLYTFRSRREDDRSQWKIRPKGYIDTPIILQQWDEVLRMIATLKLKYATASQLFRRLNSYSKQHSLYRALKAFGQIVKSMFILSYIDDLESRQAIEKQLNKIEHAHHFSRAISVGNPREIDQVEKEEQEIAQGCKRLIENCIICWNYLYLSQKLSDLKDPLERQVLMDAIAHGSIVSWRHVNLLGEYDFSEEKMRDSVGIKAPKLAA